MPKTFPQKTLFNDCLLKSSVAVCLAKVMCLRILLLQKLCKLGDDQFSYNRTT